MRTLKPYLLPDELSVDLLARLEERRYAVVVRCEGWAFAFSDMQGEYGMQAYRVEGDLCRSAFSQADSGLPEHGTHGGWTDGFAWLLGHTRRAPLRRGQNSPARAINWWSEANR